MKDKTQVTTKTKTKGKRRKKSRLPYIILFLIGLGIMLYPVISRLHYRIISSEAITSFESGKEQLSPEEIDRRMRLAFAYNEALNGKAQAMQDPYKKEYYQKGLAEYARMLEVHEQIGHVSIPKLVIDLPIYAGTSETVLRKGVGHLEGTSLPIGGNNTHTVLTAHRGLPEAKLFTDLDKLAIGDRFYITNIKETIAYQVDQIKTVEPSDFSELTIKPGHDYATLLTCTPYMINSHRLLVRGHRIDYVPAVAEKELKENKASVIYKWLFFITLAILLLVLYLNAVNYLANKKLRKEQQKQRELLEQLQQTKQASDEEND